MGHRGVQKLGDEFLTIVNRRVFTPNSGKDDPLPQLVKLEDISHITKEG